MGWIQWTGYLFGAIAAILGVIQTIRLSMTKRAAEKKKKEQNEMLVIVSNRLAPEIQEMIEEHGELFITKEEFEEVAKEHYDAHNFIEKKLETITADSTNKMVELAENDKKILEMVTKNEHYRLKAEIMDFYEDLRNNLEKSDIAFQHIYEVHSRYKKLGGNSYIESVFEKIKEYHKEVQDAKKNK